MQRTNHHDPNHQDSTGETALMKAAAAVDYFSVVDLLAQGADVHMLDNRGRTALMRAAAQPNPDIPRALIRKGAELDVRAEGGVTAMMLAAVAGEYEIVRMLLDAGADELLKDDRGRTALSFARQHGHTHVVKLLDVNPAHASLIRRLDARECCHCCRHKNKNNTGPPTPPMPSRPPSELLCPLSLELFEDPVTAPSGHTFSRAWIENHLKRSSTNPMTREPLTAKQLYPNLVAREAVERYRSQQL